MKHLVKTLSVALLITFSMGSMANDRGAILGPTTIIKAVLGQEVVSDYPGPFKGLITHDVYDTTREYVLIPKGSVVHGKVLVIGNVNEIINARVGYTINSVIRPDGTVIDMSKDAAVDHKGVSGIKDKVDRHFWAQFSGVIAYALIGAEATGTSSGGLDGSYDYGDEARRNTLDQFQPIAAKYLNVVPTITIRSGMPFNIFVEFPKKIEPYESIYDDFL